MGKLCIQVTPASPAASIAEDLCVGCGQCVKRCPFDAVRIVNLPRGVASQVSHRHGKNGFQLHRLPLPRPGAVLGLVGVNGIGKSTALAALSGRTRPNLGVVDAAPPSWADVVRHYRGSELQAHFERAARGELTCVVKPQYVDQIPARVRGTVEHMLRRRVPGSARRDAVLRELRLTHLMQRDVTALSGGELQRVAIAAVVLRRADVYMFDEPSSFLDVKQRVAAARVIRGVLRDDDAHADGGAANAAHATDGAARAPRVVCVEHDLAMLDYLSDSVCCMYGDPGAYGVVTPPYGAREGINVFLAGYAPGENVRFRDAELSFATPRAADALPPSGDGAARALRYPDMTKRMRDARGGAAFELRVHGGTFERGTVTVLLGENGTGKSTFMRLMAGRARADGQEAAQDGATVHGCTVSYKPQTIKPARSGTVRQLLHAQLGGAHAAPRFDGDVMRPLRLHDVLDREVQTLSGGELQRVALAVCLGKPADVYLIDEPSAYLDAEQRVLVSSVIQRHIAASRSAAFVVEHDLIMATHLAHQVIVYDGEPGVRAEARAPQDVRTGMNAFLRGMDVTLRRDPLNHRPRINKPDSVKDRAQKAANDYFCVD